MTPTPPPAPPPATETLRWTRINHGPPSLAEYKQKHPLAAVVTVAVLRDREQVARVTGSADDLRITVSENLKTGDLFMVATERSPTSAPGLMRVLPLSADGIRDRTRDIPRDWFLHPENRAAPAEVVKQQNTGD